ncbi:MAG: PAS domain S-box protein [Deltaproteobacteria bacterium]|nr:PAS domain S-box protein [Deltaproteobacteria bacterium]
MDFQPSQRRKALSYSGEERDTIPCWERLSCSNTGCPARGETGMPCWRLRATSCWTHGAGGHTPGIPSCILCPVFKSSAEKDERGWNRFVYEELPLLAGGASEGSLLGYEDLLWTVENLPRGLVMTDGDWRILFANAAAARLLGAPDGIRPGEMIGSLLGLDSGQFPAACCHPGEANLGMEIREVDVTMPEGRTLRLNRITLPASCSSKKDALPSHCFFLDDVSRQKFLEERLKYFEGEYRRIFEGSKDMIFVHSRGSIFKDVNQACVETLGYDSREELLALRSVERIYVNPLHRRVFQEQIDRNGFVKDFETSFWKKDGSRIHCLISGTAVRDQEGRIVGYEAIAKDITARMDGVRHLLQQHQELSLLHSVAAAMNVTHELEEILATALKKVLELLNLTMGCVFLVNQERSAFVLTVQQGFPKDLVKVGYDIRFHDEALMNSLLRKDLSIRYQRVFPPFKARLNSGQTSCELTCFLITTKEKASGFLALRIPKNRSMSDHVNQMMGSLGNFLGSAIENALLLQTIHRHREELRQLTARLFSSQEEERKRIAQELHDEVGSSLTGINFTLETVERSLPLNLPDVKESILDVKKQINRTYQEMRRISHRLRPAVLSDLGLEPALESCLARISKYSQIEIEFKMVGFEGRLDPELETVLYRISQEAVNNTLKHSGARHFKLSIVKSFPNIILLAEDNGMGFDPGSLKGSEKRALGLLGMRERAAMLGGTFTLRSSKEKGTRIRVEIPIKENSLDG